MDRMQEWKWWLRRCYRERYVKFIEEDEDQMIVKSIIRGNIRTEYTYRMEESLYEKFLEENPMYSHLKFVYVASINSEIEDEIGWEKAYVYSFLEGEIMYEVVCTLHEINGFVANDVYYYNTGKNVRDYDDIIRGKKLRKVVSDFEKRFGKERLKYIAKGETK